MEKYTDDVWIKYYAKFSGGKSNGKVKYTLLKKEYINGCKTKRELKQFVEDYYITDFTKNYDSYYNGVHVEIVVIPPENYLLEEIDNVTRVITDKQKYRDLLHSLLDGDKQ